jgi:hypothetical protein
MGYNISICLITLSTLIYLIFAVGNTFMLISILLRLSDSNKPFRTFVLYFLCGGLSVLCGTFTRGLLEITLKLFLTQEAPLQYFLAPPRRFLSTGNNRTRGRGTSHPMVQLGVINEFNKRIKNQKRLICKQTPGYYIP